MNSVKFLKDTHLELYNLNRELNLSMHLEPNELKKYFNKLYAVLKKLEPIKLQIFIDTNLYTLKDIYYNISILLREDKQNIPFHNADPKVLRSIFDKLFIKLLRIQNNLNATILFKEFINNLKPT